jgi:hypothetical protein
MKRIVYIFLLFAILFSSEAKSNHCQGYDMSLISVGSDSYRFRLVLYRDVTGITLANSYSFGIFKNSDNSAAPTTTMVVNKVSQVAITYNQKDCPPKGADLKLEKWTYESSTINLSAFNSVSGYYVISNECCRTPGISNVLNSSSSGILFTMDFPRLNSTSPTRYNSSPEFRKTPLAFFNVGKIYTLDWGVVDPNGDSLVYKVVQPRNNSSTKPFTKVDFAPGYKLDSNIADGAPDFNINSQTGIITYKPNNIGRYLIAVRVEEWKRASGSTPGVKIGEITREFQIENTYTPEAPPELNQRMIVDTIYYNNVYDLIFDAYDFSYDSLYMMIKIDTTSGENILDPVNLGGKWGEAGSFLGNNPNLIIEEQSMVRGEFNWQPNCKAVREKPYKFSVIVRDNTCPYPLYDTTDVYIYVIKPPNNQPYFVSPDTMTSNSIKNYYLKAGEKFQLTGDSIIKTYDKDSINNIVSIHMEPYLSNGAVNSKFLFTQSPNNIHSSATFSWQSGCKDARIEPYKIKFIAEDDDCLKHDSITFEINLYVSSQINATPINGLSIISDTSLFYTYVTNFTPGINYYWHGKDLTIISGQGTDSVKVKWNKIGANQILCEFSSSQTRCIYTSALNITITTGINDIKNSNIKIYPNPTNNIINIEGLNKNENSTIQIFDVQGKLVITKTINEKGAIDLSELNKGVYVIKIGEVAQRIVKM